MSSKSLLEQESHLAFGINWLDYAKKIDEEKIFHAVENLRRLSGRQRLDGRSFLDIGCGSGLHSVAALRLGASSVRGVDIDQDAVVAAKSTLVRFAPGASYGLEVCAVFDMTPEKYGTFDIVYSWRVLHDTGDMARAIASAAALVKLGGQLCLALYRRTPFCGMWRVIKRWYSRSKPHHQSRALLAFCYLERFVFLVKGADHKAHVQTFGQLRGMDYDNDLHDWLGGYPYESISPDECRLLLSHLGVVVGREFLQHSRRILPGLMGTGCNEYSFRLVGHSSELES